MTFYILGKALATTDDWTLMGLFDEEHIAEQRAWAKAQNLARTGDDPWYFIGPLPLNVRLPVEDAPWPGFEYPGCVKIDGDWQVPATE